MATSKKSVQAHREQQLNEITDSVVSLSDSASEIGQQQETLDLLESVSSGLYEEIDKLAKKSPADQISSLVLGQVNDVIRESRELAKNDPFMKRYAEFVPAGDNPEHRDVVVVLRQVRQGLERFRAQLAPRRERTTELLSDARGIRIALVLQLQGHEEVTIRDIESNKITVSKYWLDNFGRDFNFDLLDRTEIPGYFEPPK